MGPQFPRKTPCPGYAEQASCRTISRTYLRHRSVDDALEHGEERGTELGARGPTVERCGAAHADGGVGRDRHTDRGPRVHGWALQIPIFGWRRLDGLTDSSVRHVL